MKTYKEWKVNRLTSVGIPWEPVGTGWWALCSRPWRWASPGTPPSRHCPSIGRGAEWSPRRRKKPHRTDSWQSSCWMLTILLQLLRFLRHSGASALGLTVPSSRLSPCPLGSLSARPLCASPDQRCCKTNSTGSFPLRRCQCGTLVDIGEVSIIGSPFRYVIVVAVSQELQSNWLHTV